MPASGPRAMREHAKMGSMTIAIGPLPPLAWTHGAGVAETSSDGLVLTAAARTDWFNDPGTGDRAARLATSLSFDPGDTDFQLSARVGVAGTRSTFDAGVLTLWGDDDHWAKLCFEQSPQGQAMVVSVVTDGRSDDANGPVIDEPAVWLRISRIGVAFAFHYSQDGRHWHFARHFRLSGATPLAVGFLAQAPLGERAVASFDEISFARRTLADLRDGS